MDKRHLIDQLASQLRAAAGVAARAGAEAAEIAQNGATPAEKREDARVALEYSRMARAQAARAERAREELSRLSGFQPKPLPRGARIVLGAIVEIENEEGEGRTFFLAPVGAGLELSGPGGDGFLSVVTPASPMGKAVLGKRLGDVVDIDVRGETREWTITYVE